MGKEYTKRSIRLIFGLFLYGVGSYMGIQANVGLAPWEAFSMGIFYKTGNALWRYSSSDRSSHHSDRLPAEREDRLRHGAECHNDRKSGGPMQLA